MKEIYKMDSEFSAVFQYPIERLLRESDSLVAAHAALQDIYSLGEYQKLGAVKRVVLLDNNILTRLIHLAKGLEINGDGESVKNYKYCCALMCFFILNDIDIETNISFYERASSNGHQKAIDEYSCFMIANHIHPIIYAELALGITKKNCAKQIEYTRDNIKIVVPEESNFSKQLNDWKLIYSHLLKAKILLRDEPKPVKRIEQMMEWFTSESSVLPSSLLFILILLSPKSGELGSLVKKINSSEFTTLKNGLKNAAWDLTYLTTWRKLTKSQPETLWFFCSLDKKLQSIARLLYARKGEGRDEALYKFVEEYWGKKSPEINRYYENLGDALNEESRETHNNNVLSKIDIVIEKLELNLENS